MGAVVGYGSVKSASRMNSAVVIFVDSIEKAHQLIESGVVIQGSLTPFFSLVNPAKKSYFKCAPFSEE